MDIQGMFTTDIVRSSATDESTRDPFSIRIFAQAMPTTEAASQTSTRGSVGGENVSPARELGHFVDELSTNNATGMNGAWRPLAGLLLS